MESCSFQSTHPARGATFNRTSAPTVFQFQSTHPARGATCATCKHWVMVDVFQSTHPARGATGAHLGRTLRRMISIHAPREGCDPAACPRSHSSSISIHAPREGCDTGRRKRMGWIRRISIHAPREGCDSKSGLTTSEIAAFQSTHPARGATAAWPPVFWTSLYFNPRTPRGVRQQTLPKSREFAWLNLLICTRGRRLSIQKQTRLCSIKLSFMLFGCEPAGEGVSSWTSHATKSKVRLEGRSA